MPTNKQRREAARRHLERQLERRQEREAARRRVALIASVAGTVVLLLVIVIFVVAVTGDKKKSTAAASTSPTAAASSSAAPTAKTTGPCGYAQSADVGQNPDLKEVGVPPDPNPTPTTARTMVITTPKGEIDIALDASVAPCNVQSVAYLAAQKFYDNTSCHRLVTSGIFVLQCGDPSGTGAGGPTYTVKDENLDKAAYTEGVVAMANGGANTNSSQFFIMTKDSSAGLQKAYTQIGKVTKGLDIVQAIAAGGVSPAPSATTTTDGSPAIPLTFTTVTVTPAVTGSGTLSSPPAASTPAASTPAASTPAGSAPAATTPAAATTSG